MSYQYEDGDSEDLYKNELIPLLQTPPSIRAQLYLDQRDRAIKLFRHYPVLDVKIERGTQPQLTLLPATLQQASP